MYGVIMTSWIAILQRASLTPFPLERQLAGTHQTQAKYYKYTGNSTLSTAFPAAGSTLYDNTPTSRPWAHDIPMDVRIQEEHLNPPAKHLVDTVIQNALGEVQHEEEPECAELSEQEATKQFLIGMEIGRRESQLQVLKDEQSHLERKMQTKLKQQTGISKPC